MIRTRNLMIFLCILVFGIFLFGSVQPSLAGSDSTSVDMSVYLPLIMKPDPKTAIVADHRHTDISQIPDEWIEQAKRACDPLCAYLPWESNTFRIGMAFQPRPAVQGGYPGERYSCSATGYDSYAGI